MGSVWLVVGSVNSKAPPERAYAFATEDGAYAELGRIAYKAGAVGDLEVAQLDVVGGQAVGPDTPPDVPIPDWVKRLHLQSGLWSTGRAGEGPDTVQVRDADGDWCLVLRVTGGATNDDDKDAAAWVATVLQREAGR